MSTDKHTECSCSRCQAARRDRSRPLGLDELMIVNPGSPATGSTRGDEGRYFLGDDGALYRAETLRDDGTGQSHPNAGSNARAVKALGLGHYFLGADGALYEVIE